MDVTSLLTAVSYLAWSHQECSFFLLPETASTRQTWYQRPWCHDPMALSETGKPTGMTILRHPLGLTKLEVGHPGLDIGYQHPSSGIPHYSGPSSNEVGKGFEKEPCPSERSRRTSSRSATQSECEECCNCNIITQSILTLHLESGTFLCLAAYKSFVSTAKL